MASFDIVAFIKNNITGIIPSAQVVASAVMSAMFLRRKTSVETGTEEFEKIKAAKFSEAIDMLLESRKITYTDYWKMKNYAEIAKRADELKSDQKKEIPTQSFDWHTRFYEACGNISDDEMQEIWSAVLSGEINNPGSYSLRTLDCLRNISKEEAKLFKKVCECSVKVGGTVFLPCFGGIMEKNGITYDDVIRMDDCGLVKSDSGITISLDVDEHFKLVTYDDLFVLIVKKREESSTNRLTLRQYLFTAAGKELFSIVGSKMNMEDLCETLQAEYQDLEFACGQIISKEGNHIKYVVTSVSLSKTVKQEVEKY